MEEEVAELPDPVLFERAGWRSPAAPSAKQSTSTPACTPSVTAVGTFRSAATSRSLDADASRTSDSRLFDRGATVRTASRLEGCGANGSTLSARLRTSGLRLMCYINTDDNSRTRSCFVSIPESTQTLKDVLAVIQRVMRLDRRFLYARQIFLPDGEVVTSYRALVDAASNDTPVIVGCGEPFNRDGVPPHMLLAHLAGTGRDAPKGIKREFEQKRVKAAQLKADQDGHHPLALARVPPTSPLGRARMYPADCTCTSLPSPAACSTHALLLHPPHACCTSYNRCARRATARCRRRRGTRASLRSSTTARRCRQGIMSLPQQQRFRALGPCRKGRPKPGLAESSRLKSAAGYLRASQLAARLRHEQMQGMMRRAAQEDQFMEAVRQRTVHQRAAAAQSARRVKTQEEDRRVRMALARSLNLPNPL